MVVFSLSKSSQANDCSDFGEVYQSPDNKIRGLVDAHLNGPAAITRACKR